MFLLKRGKIRIPFFLVGNPLQSLQRQWRWSNADDSSVDTVHVCQQDPSKLSHCRGVQNYVEFALSLE
ncbi:hypothetical protein J1N35_042152 [Gossypium stocksii]|uniref:Uncharacterized protein n=1 Tax=Gossypium stocksii TaxID=47602 RepID=A0A9D3ZKB7_9ROSI|nr:hypothetical protein J1N35_042152 [Gossypium stocksii]